MGSAQTSIDALVGPPTAVIPFLAYADGTYNPETTAAGVYANGATASITGDFADVSNYRGAIIQCVVSRLPGSNANALTIIPYHGPCAEFVTHDPFGAGWGFYWNGKAHASPSTSEVRNIYVDTQFCSQYLSVQAVLAAGAPALFGVTVIPILPKTSPRLDDFEAGNLLSVYESGPLNLVG